MKTFLDTNILVYSLDPTFPEKQRSARQAIESCVKDGIGVVSTQVLQELYVTATRKLGVSPLIAKQILRQLECFEIVRITPELILEGIDISILNEISFWDGLIVAAAVNSRCERLWSEDLNSGQRIQGIQVRNPLA